MGGENNQIIKQDSDATVYDVLLSNVDQPNPPSSLLSLKIPHQTNKIVHKAMSDGNPGFSSFQPQATLNFISTETGL